MPERHGPPVIGPLPPLEDDEALEDDELEEDDVDKLEELEEADDVDDAVEADDDVDEEEVPEEDELVDELLELAKELEEDALLAPPPPACGPVSPELPHARIPRPAIIENPMIPRCFVTDDDSRPAKSPVCCWVSYRYRSTGTSCSSWALRSGTAGVRVAIVPVGQGEVRVAVVGRQNDFILNLYISIKASVEHQVSTVASEGTSRREGLGTSQVGAGAVTQGMGPGRRDRALWARVALLPRHRGELRAPESRAFLGGQFARTKVPLAVPEQSLRLRVLSLLLSV